MPPRKAPAVSAEPPRRSSRIKDQPQPLPKKGPAKPRKKKAPAAALSKKDDIEEEDAPASPKGRKRVAASDEETDELSDEKPKTKKAKPSPTEKSAAKPPSAAAKPASKASRTGSKPPSKAKGDVKMHSAKENTTVAPITEDSDEEDYASPQALVIGDVLPAITLKDQGGDDVAIAEIASSKGVVLFLIPKADTPGCNKQACAFRDSYEEFTKMDYDVYCVSADSPTAQAKWKTKKELQYSLLSDPKRELIAALGAASGKSTKRSHFVFEKGSGKLLEQQLGVKPDQSTKLALEFIQNL